MRQCISKYNAEQLFKSKSDNIKYTSVITKKVTKF